MFKRTNKDFVALHSKGFQSKENVDLFNHVLRLLLKNHHILKVKPEYARKTKNISRRIQDQELDRDSDDGEEVDEDDVEYVPIEIKQFVLETSQKEIGMLDHIITMYEQKTGLNLHSHETVKKEEEYSSHKLEEEMTQENEFLEEILKQVNEKGVESVNLNQMIRFRQIMKRRLEVFSRLQAHIEVSGLLRTKPVTAREAKLKEELRQTFLQVKQITALKSVFHFAEPLVKATSPMSFNSLNHIMSPRDSLGSPWSPFNGGPKDPEMMASAIRRSLETARTLERTARGYNKEFDTEPAVLELESLESYDESSRGLEHSQRKVVRSLTSLTPVAASARTWGKGDDFSMKISEESFEGKKPSLQAVVSRVKRKRRLSIPLPTKNERRIQRGETKIGTVLTEGERQRRLERLLSKHPEPPPMYIDEERDLDLVKGRGQKKQNKLDMHREIERAWKEKDFGFLKAYLIGDLDKKNIKDNSDEEEGGTKRGKDDEKKNLRKKKKKRNPNVSTSSGSVITMTANKLKKGFTKNAREGDGTFDGEKDDYGDDDGIEEEEEDEDLFSRHYLMKAKTQEPPILRRNTFRIDIDKTFKNNRKQNNIQRYYLAYYYQTNSLLDLEAFPMNEQLLLTEEAKLSKKVQESRRKNLKIK